jgi:hypothetical protein
MTNEVDRRSLKRDDLPTFELLEKTYRTRNSLVHAGELGYRDSRRQLVPVDRHQVNRFWEACERALDWLSAL